MEYSKKEFVVLPNGEMRLLEGTPDEIKSQASVMVQEALIKDELARRGFDNTFVNDYLLTREVNLDDSNRYKDSIEMVVLTNGDRVHLSGTPAEREHQKRTCDAYATANMTALRQNPNSPELLEAGVIRAWPQFTYLPPASVRADALGKFDLHHEENAYAAPTPAKKSVVENVNSLVLAGSIGFGAILLKKRIEMGRIASANSDKLKPSKPPTPWDSFSAPSPHTKT